MNRNSKLLTFAAVGILAALLGALAARNVLEHSAAPVLTSGTYIEPARPSPRFQLVDHDGMPFDVAGLQGRWTLMFFGFTNCGDICPTTLTLLATVSRSLSDLPKSLQPQIVFVSVDAARDTPTVLKNYIAHFDANFIGVTGRQADLDAFTSALGVPSAIRPLDTGYAVDHSAAILAFNTCAEFQALFGAPQTAAALQADYRTLAGTQCKRTQ